MSANKLGSGKQSIETHLFANARKKYDSYKGSLIVVKFEQMTSRLVFTLAGVGTFSVVFYSVEILGSLPFQ